MAPPKPPPPVVSPYDDGITAPEDVFGPACARRPGGAAGAVAGQAVATALSASPTLSVLFDALRTAKLAGRLDGMVELTMFAPTDEAFVRYRDRIGAQRYAELMTDPARLADVLSYHVLVKRYDRRGLLASSEDGLATLYGGTMRFRPAADTIDVVDGTDNPVAVVCGNLPTANATVFMVDDVLIAARPDQIFRRGS